MRLIRHMQTLQSKNRPPRRFCQERIQSLIISDDKQLPLRPIHTRQSCEEHILLLLCIAGAASMSISLIPKIWCGRYSQSVWGLKRFIFRVPTASLIPILCPKVSICSDMDALEVAGLFLAPHEPYQLKTLPKSERNRLLAVLRHRGFTIDQISRLTGIGTNIIQRAK